MDLAEKERQSEENGACRIGAEGCCYHEVALVKRWLTVIGCGSLSQ